MKKYFIQDYFSGLTILDDKGYYTRYFYSIQDVENFLNSASEFVTEPD